MSWLSYNFACPCGTIYEDIVQGTEGRPDPCPTCGGLEAEKRLSMPVQVKEFIPMYPGNKRMMAGHAVQERRPAEKRGRQVSMAGTKR
jgi:hypothetical protein